MRFSIALRYKPLVSFFVILLVLIGGMTWFILQFSTKTLAHIASNNQSIASSGSSSLWMTHPSSIEGKIVHFTLIESVYIRKPTGPALVRTLLGDIWEQINSHGQLILFHGIYTTLDRKTFYQEIYQSASSNMIVLGKSDLDHRTLVIPDKPSTNSCVLQFPISSSGISNSEIVPFANIAVMKDLHFSSAVNPDNHSYIIPETLLPIHTTPILKYVSTGSPRTWEKINILANIGAKQILIVEVDQQNRVLFTSSERVGVSGQIDSSSKFSYGSVQIYNQTDTSQYMFPTTQQILAKGCAR